MAALYNLARMTVTSGGTGTLTLGTNVPGFIAFASAGVPDSAVVAYAIEDGNSREVAYGTWNASAKTLTRNTRNSTNGNAPLAVSTSAHVFIAPAAEDLQNFAAPISAPTIVSLGELGTHAGVVRFSSNGLKFIWWTGTKWTTSEGDFAFLNGNQTITGGFDGTSYPVGTISSGTFTPNPKLSNIQHATFNGALTLSSPAGVCSMVIEVTLGASAGAVTFSGFTKVTGSYSPTNGNKFLFVIFKTNSYSFLQIIPGQ